MLAEQLIEAAKEAAAMPTNQDLMTALERVGAGVLGLCVLVLLVGIFVTRGQRRIARNQIELADLVRAAKGDQG